LLDRLEEPVTST